MYKKLIGKEVPVNSTAARVVKPGISYEIVHRDIPTLVSDVPLPTKPFTGPAEADLTGKVIGDLTVIGFFGKKRNDRSGRWVTRCSCGKYCIKTTPTIKSHSYLYCPICDKRERYKRSYTWAKTGKEVPSKMESSKIKKSLK